MPNSCTLQPLHPRLLALWTICHGAPDFGRTAVGGRFLSLILAAPSKMENTAYLSDLLGSGRKWDRKKCFGIYIFFLGLRDLKYTFCLC